jgi:hypothetical protein
LMTKIKSNVTRATVKKFDWESVAKQYGQLYL